MRPFSFAKVKAYQEEKENLSQKEPSRLTLVTVLKLCYNADWRISISFNAKTRLFMKMASKPEKGEKIRDQGNIYGLYRNHGSGG